MRLNIAQEYCDHALFAAVYTSEQEKHLELVRLLLDYADPMYDDSGALQWAAKNNCPKMVALLLPRSNPKADNSTALQWALANHNEELIDLLYPLSDIEAAINGLHKSQLSDLAQDLQQYHTMKEEQRILSEVTVDKGTTPLNKKM